MWCVGLMEVGFVLFSNIVWLFFPFLFFFFFPPCKGAWLLAITLREATYSTHIGLENWLVGSHPSAGARRAPVAVHGACLGPGAPSTMTDPQCQPQPSEMHKFCYNNTISCCCKGLRAARSIFFLLKKAQVPSSSNGNF